MSRRPPRFLAAACVLPWLVACSTRVDLQGGLLPSTVYAIETGSDAYGVTCPYRTDAGLCLPGNPDGGPSALPRQYVVVANNIQLYADFGTCNSLYYATKLAQISLVRDNTSPVPHGVYPIRVGDSFGVVQDAGTYATMLVFQGDAALAATDGSVTLTSSSSGGARGHFEASFTQPDGGLSTLSGSFDVPYCCPPGTECAFHEA